VLGGWLGGGLAVGPSDVRDDRAVTRFRDAVLDHFGRADILVHSAGASRMLRFEDTDDAAWRDELELKYFGFIYPTRAFLKLLRASEHPSIVYVSALLGVEPSTRLIATSATRGGVLNLAKSLSVEFAPAGIRVNTILLGIIDSAQWQRRFEAERARGRTITREDYMRELVASRNVPLGRAGTPEDVARAIAFLGSPASAYTTGAMLEISGGQSHRV
jgi:NAD(P)-dependent dehydrogenase (short-subunit alcohol dehydrogenase family)